jgi:hypothetical protein
MTIEMMKNPFKWFLLKTRWWDASTASKEGSLEIEDGLESKASLGRTSGTLQDRIVSTASGENEKSRN